MIIRLHTDAFSYKYRLKGRAERGAQKHASHPLDCHGKSDPSPAQRNPQLSRIKEMVHRLLRIAHISTHVWLI